MEEKTLAAIYKIPQDTPDSNSIVDAVGSMIMSVGRQGVAMQVGRPFTCKNFGAFASQG